jgi:hypothetical protein
MSKELPFFKFFPAEWLIGKISFKPLEIQGAFIQAVCICWQNNGRFNSEDIDFRIGDENLKKLVESGFLKQDDNGYFIEFLEEQINEFEEVREKRRLAGSNGGKQKIASAKQNVASAKQVLPNAKQSVANAKQNVAEKKRKEEEKRREEKDSTKKVFFGENKKVALTEAEYDKLIAELDIDITERCIKKLDHYKNSSGRIYKSDYSAMHTWVIDQVKTEIKTEPNRTDFKGKITPATHPQYF